MRKRLTDWLIDHEDPGIDIEPDYVLVVHQHDTHFFGRDEQWVCPPEYEPADVGYVARTYYAHRVVETPAGQLRHVATHGQLGFFTGSPAAIREALPASAR